MIWKKPDGELELGTSSCTCCPPGLRREGLHTNATANWMRINGGEWQRVTSQARFLRAAKSTETVEDFEKALRT